MFKYVLVLLITLSKNSVVQRVWFDFSLLFLLKHQVEEQQQQQTKMSTTLLAYCQSCTLVSQASHHSQSTYTSIPCMSTRLKCTWWAYLHSTEHVQKQIPEPQRFNSVSIRSLNGHKHLQALRFFAPAENSLKLRLWCMLTQMASSSLLCNADTHRAFVRFSWWHFCILRDLLFGRCGANNTNAFTTPGLVEKSNVKIFWVSFVYQEELFSKQRLLCARTVVSYCLILNSSSILDPIHYSV